MPVTPGAPSSDGASPRDPHAASIEAILDGYGRVAYTHKTHEKECELSGKRRSALLWANAVIAALTVGGIVATSQGSVPIMTFASGAVTAVAIGFTCIWLAFSQDVIVEQHRRAADELRSLRDRYLAVIADVKDRPEKLDVPRLRDELFHEFDFMCRLVPKTSGRAYRAAKKALQEDAELTFEEGEIDHLLPPNLRSKRPRP